MANKISNASPTKDESITPNSTIMEINTNEPTVVDVTLSSPEESEEKLKRLLAYMEELLSLAQQAMQAATSPYANDVDESLRQRFYFYSFSAVVTAVRKIAEGDKGLECIHRITTYLNEMLALSEESLKAVSSDGGNETDAGKEHFAHYKFKAVCCGVYAIIG